MEQDFQHLKGKVFLPYILHLAILPFPWARRWQKDVFQCVSRLLHKASESARGEGPGDQEGTWPHDGAAATTMLGCHPQALGCSLQLPQLLLRFHFDNLLSQNEGTGLQGVSLPHSGWGHTAHCLLCAEAHPAWYWLSRFWAPAPFLLQSKQQLHLTPGNPIQHQAGCSYSQEALFPKNLAILCWFSTLSHAKSWGGALKELSG